jgi:hypothetical protein
LFNIAFRRGLKRRHQSKTRRSNKEVLCPGLEGTNPGIPSKASVTIRINARVEAQPLDLRKWGGFSPGTP